ncbi:MAG: GTPase ObgE [Ruminococcaceae bacterium]|nr:GTPase ObgE [Oscillospiraceae bacterium]
MIFDRVKIYCKAGDGGNGCVSFHREKYVAKGGPDGGDGGNGGSIIFKIDEGATTLLYYKYRRKFVAQSGGDGRGSKWHGANGEDLVLLVPRGTLIKDAETGAVIKDMSDCDEFVVCRGGRGGWGNKHFATPTRQIPRFAKSGIKGDEKEIALELKMIADVGLVGLPNVGKSSILSVISASKPKIGNYNFTTLSPNLGVVKVRDNEGFIAADIPGLIEGASEGAGLGHEFLRHVERCRLLIHVVDISGQNCNDPIEDIELINNELITYSEALAHRPQIICANKADMIDNELVDIEEFEEYVRDNGWELIYVSAITRENIDKLVSMVWDRLALLPPTQVFESTYVEPEITDSGSFDVSIRNENGIYVVEADWLYKVMGSVNFDDYESLSYFQKVLKDKGVIAALEEKGCGDGDTVSIYDFEFDFIK